MTSLPSPSTSGVDVHALDFVNAVQNHLDQTRAAFRQPLPGTPSRPASPRSSAAPVCACLNRSPRPFMLIRLPRVQPTASWPTAARRRGGRQRCRSATARCCFLPGFSSPPRDAAGATGHCVGPEFLFHRLAHFDDQGGFFLPSKPVSACSRPVAFPALSQRPRSSRRSPAGQTSSFNSTSCECSATHPVDAFEAEPLHHVVPLPGRAVAGSVRRRLSGTATGRLSSTATGRGCRARSRFGRFRGGGSLPWRRVAPLAAVAASGANANMRNRVISKQVFGSGPTCRSR